MRYDWLYLKVLYRAVVCQETSVYPELKAWYLARIIRRGPFTFLVSLLQRDVVLQSVTSGAVCWLLEHHTRDEMRWD